MFFLDEGLSFRWAFFLFLLFSPLWPQRVVETLKTPYNHIQIYQSNQKNYLYFLHTNKKYLESTIDLANPYSLPVPYTQLFSAGYLYPQKLESILMLGVGGGTFTTYSHHYMPEVRIDGVDIDTGVVAMARKYFFLREDKKYQIYIQDAYRYLQQHSQKYSIIYADTYRGGYIPAHLLTESYFQLLQTHVDRGGCLVLNIGYENNYYKIIVELKKLFSKIELYKYPHSSNRVVIAYSHNQTIADLQRVARELQENYQFSFAPERILRFRTVLWNK